MAATSEAAPVVLPAPGGAPHARPSSSQPSARLPAAAADGDGARLGSAAPGRVLGLDIARACAIVGMFAVHVGPLDDLSAPGRVYALAHGRASLLFVLVAGVGVSLLVRSRRHTTREARLTLWWRALLLLPLGLLLQHLDHGVNVILQGYALLFVLASLVVTLSNRWLLVLAGAFATTGPALFLTGQVLDPGRFDRSSIAWGDSAAEVVDGLVLSGPYPLVTWAAPLLIGMWLGRQDLTDARVARRLLVGGALVGASSVLLGHGLGHVLAVDGIGARLASVAPHSQMPLWLIGGTASATAVLGLALLLGPRLPRLLAPLAALGQIALTAYVVHLVALHAFATQARTGDLAVSVLIVLLSAGVLAAAAMWWRTRLPQGPLERLMRLPRPVAAAGRR